MGKSQRKLRENAALNYKTKIEPVPSAAIGFQPVLDAVLGPESVLTCPNSKIYSNLSLSCNSTRKAYVTSLGNCLVEAVT